MSLRIVFTNTITVSAFLKPNCQSQINLLLKAAIKEGVLSEESLTGYRIPLTNIDVHNKTKIIQKGLFNNLIHLFFKGLYKAKALLN